MEYELLPIEEVELDKDNPRIKHFIEMYGDNITSDQIALALSYSPENSSGSSITALRESIKANQGIIQPILVNKTLDSRYVVIEGNTRVQIYREFKENKVPGPWDRILSIVYDNLPENKIHAIRLQCHLVGARDWDPYSKAKYLCYLSEDEGLPLTELVSYCGGKTGEVNNLINAYKDMTKYYEPAATEAGEEPDPKEFSKFSELQNKRIIDSLVLHKYTKEDFAEWVVNGNIDTAQNVRKIPQILNCERARKEFFKTNITEAIKYLNADDRALKRLEAESMYDLARALTMKLRNITLKETNNLAYNPDFSDRRSYLDDLKFELDSVMKNIEEG